MTIHLKTQMISSESLRPILGCKTEARATDWELVVLSI